MERKNRLYKRQRSPKKELIENYENLGVTNYILSDDTLNDSDYKINPPETFTSPFELTFSCLFKIRSVISHKNPNNC